MVALSGVGCTIPLLPGEPTTASVQFLNNCKQTLADGTVIYYSVRNLAALNETWPNEVAYGDKSASKDIPAHTGDIAVTGQIKSATGTTWVNGNWTISQNLVAGQSYVLELTY